MKKLFIIATLLVGSSLLLSADLTYAQSRDLGAYRLILDNGGSPAFRLTIRADPAMVGDATFTFPAGGGSFPDNGTIDGQTLRWNNGATMWQPSSLLTNTGTRLGFGTISPQFEMHFRDTLTSPTATINSDTYTDGTGAFGSAGFYGANFSAIANGTNPLGSSSTIGLAGRSTSVRGAGNTVPRALGVVGSIDNLGLGVVTEGTSVVGQIANTGGAGATMTTSIAFDSRYFNSGTITNAIGFRFAAPFIVGTLTNLDAVLVEDIASSSSNGNAFRYAHATDPVSINSAGKLTLGAIPTTLGDRLEVRSTSTASTQVLGVYGRLDLAPSLPTTQNSYGLAYDVNANDGDDMSTRSLVGVGGRTNSNRSAGAVSRLIGTFGSASTASSASNPEITGVYGEAFGNGSGTITDAHGVMGRIFAGAGTITNAMAIQASNGSTFGGTITNAYGLFIEPVTLGSTSNTAILYDHPTAPFTVLGNGDVGIRNANPVLSLDIAGSAGIRSSGFIALGATLGHWYYDDNETRSYFSIEADAAGSNWGGFEPVGDGQIIIMHSTGPGDMTIINESGSVPAENFRIRTMAGADVATTGEAMFTFIYNEGIQRWLLLSVQD